MIPLENRVISSITFSLSFFNLVFPFLLVLLPRCVRVIFVERDPGTVCDKMMAV